MAAVAFMMLDGQDFLDGERLVSTLTYSNAFSAYVAAMIVLGYYLIHLEEKIAACLYLGHLFFNFSFHWLTIKNYVVNLFPGILFLLWVFLRRR